MLIFFVVNNLLINGEILLLIYFPKSIQNLLFLAQNYNKFLFSIFQKKFLIVYFLLQVFYSTLFYLEKLPQLIPN
jgi:hypothetical protein